MPGQLSLFEFTPSWTLYLRTGDIEVLPDLVDFDLVDRYEGDYVLTDKSGNLIWDSRLGRWPY